MPSKMKYGQNSGMQDSHPAVHMNPNNWTKYLDKGTSQHGGG